MGLRAHVVGLVLATLLPALAVGAMAVWAAVEGQQAGFETGLRDTARALALAVDAEIDAFRAAMATLAGSSSLDGAPPDLPAFEREARRAAAALGTAVLLIDPASLRHVVNTDLPEGDRPTGRSREAFRSVADTRRPLVVDLAVGVPDHPAVASVAVPVGRGGGVPFVLAARLDPARFGALLAAQARRGSFATLVDGANVVVARSRDGPRVVGEGISPWIAAGTAGREAGFLRGTNRLGEEVVIAFHRLPDAPGWMVVVGEPLAAYRGAAWRPVRELAVGGAATAALALLAATLIGGRILRPVRALTRQAEAVAVATGAGGAAAARPAPGSAPRAAAAGDRPSGVAEFERLGEAARRAEAALRESGAFLRSVLDASTDRLEVVERDGTLSFMNANGLRLMEMDDLAPVEGKDWASLWPEAGAARVREAAADALAGRPARFEAFCPTAKGTPKWWEVVVSPVLDAEGGVSRLVAASRDITARREAEERQRLLLREVDHRAKNALAVVQSVVRLTRAEDPEGYAKAVVARVAALSRAHSLLADKGWAGADLRRLLAAETAAHAAAVDLDGPDLPLSATATQPIAMVAHELATNAAKHGALSREGGRVAIRWGVEGGDLRLVWREEGGPGVQGPPTRRGFGSRLIEATVEGQLGGAVERRWEGGLECVVRVPAAKALAASASASAAA